MGVRNQCLKIRFAMGIGRSLPLSISSSVVVNVDSLLIWDSLDKFPPEEEDISSRYLSR